MWSSPARYLGYPKIFFTTLRGFISFYNQEQVCHLLKVSRQSVQFGLLMTNFDPLVGYGNVPCEAAKEHGVAVCNAPGKSI